MLWFVGGSFRLNRFSIGCSVVFNKLLHLFWLQITLKHFINIVWMTVSLFKFFKLHPRKFFFVVDSKEVHVFFSVCSPLFFGSFCDAFGLLFLLSFAFFSPLNFLISDKGKGLIGDNEVIRGDRRLGRINLEEFGCASQGGFFLWFFLDGTLEN